REEASSRTQGTEPIDRSKLLQQLWVPIVKTDNLGELRPITDLVLNYLSPDFYTAEQQGPPCECETVLFPGANDSFERIDTVLPSISRSRLVGEPNVVFY